MNLPGRLSLDESVTFLLHDSSALIFAADKGVHNTYNDLYQLV